ncbi:MAG: tRNA preQ1(34) S-adenosylmethionine ribosyltransferase-isomerase QueA [Cycloclasticus sp. symbiont of Poecilosclerida sp. M]|nr:MAG: tRNA preQ1(34) S-adenosylmethionine ribosyltransferase-isomerase QueA [Cycloclasticus sp. symbiont of Poecilosclerida sp. M]
MQKSDFNYTLPNELIAKYPLKNRVDSRLLVVEPSHCDDRSFSDFLSCLKQGDLLVFNNTRVIPARLFGKKITGGQLEILIERVLDETSVIAHIRCSKSPKANTQLILDNDYRCTVAGREDDLFNLTFNDPVQQVLADIGHIPLPPYIDRDDESLDVERYQTVFSQQDGAVAAPTAGLHFDTSMLQNLDKIGVDTCFVTLHVGSGTFQPVREECLDDHIMHKEWFSLGADVVEQVNETRQRGGRVIAVGTTAVRALESASQSGALKPYEGETQLFIRPGYRFQSVDAMITNFHLPESTLLMLVSAFSGYKTIMDAYHYAIEQKYRFFSYGDAMFLTNTSNVNEKSECNEV